MTVGLSTEAHVLGVCVYPPHTPPPPRLFFLLIVDFSTFSFFAVNFLLVLGESCVLGWMRGGIALMLSILYTSIQIKGIYQLKRITHVQMHNLSSLLLHMAQGCQSSETGFLMESGLQLGWAQITTLVFYIVKK